MDNTNTFQIILLSVFGLAALLGVVLFATGTLSGNPDDQQPVSFSIWGEWESDVFNSVLDQSGVADSDAITISYTSVTSGDLEDRLVNALARNGGPDVLLTSHTNLLRFADLITNIGENAYPARQFRNSFIEGSEIFLQPSGVRALPLAVDPLVMYWNRDILTESGFVSPPERWSEVPGYTQRIVDFDTQGDMQTAGIGLGSARNVNYLKEILSTLFLQAGNSVVALDEKRDFVSQLNKNQRSLQSAVSQYRQYANPSTDAYAWNNSFSSTRQAFTSGNLAFYLAPASDIRSIRSQNPNLNFDVTTVPQLEGGQTRTHGNFYGFAILDRAPNKLAILNVLERLTDTSAAQAVSNRTDLVPVRKDVLAAGASDAYKQVSYDSAIISRGWYDPDSSISNDIFAMIISDVASGRRTVSSALQHADVSLQNSINNVLPN